MSRITTVKDKIPKKSILARIFGLRQGFKDKSCPGQEFRETRTRFHPWIQNEWMKILRKKYQSGQDCSTSCSALSERVLKKAALALNTPCSLVTESSDSPNLLWLVRICQSLTIQNWMGWQAHGGKTSPNNRQGDSRSWIYQKNDRPGDDGTLRSV